MHHHVAVVVEARFGSALADGVFDLLPALVQELALQDAGGVVDFVRLETGESGSILGTAEVGIVAHRIILVWLVGW